MSKLEVGDIYTTPNLDDYRVVVDNIRSRGIDSRSTYQRTADLPDSDRTVIGRLPPNQLDATEWRDEYKLPEGYDPKKHDLYWDGKWWLAHWEWTQYVATDAEKQCIVKKALDCPDNRQVHDTHTEWQNKLQAWAGKNNIKPGTKLIDAVLETADDWKAAMLDAEERRKKACVGARVLVEKAEKDRDKALDNYGRTLNDLDHVKDAFRAATGSYYDPSRDYSAPLGTEENPIAVSDIPIVRLSPKKGRPMFKFLAKPVLYTAIAALCLNLNTIKDSTIEWWNAPTALELGDWVRVHSCDTCHSVTPNLDPKQLCPKCGGETFSSRKAQKLLRDDWIDYGLRGHIFADGTVSVAPGHWVIPEREVKND